MNLCKNCATKLESGLKSGPYPLLWHGAARLLLIKPTATTAVRMHFDEGEQT